MVIHLKELAINLTQQALPLIQKGMEMMIENKSIEKRSLIANEKIEKLEQSLVRFEKMDNQIVTTKNTKNITQVESKLSNHKLTTGVLEGEDKIALGHRKWSEYENHLSDLSDNATPEQVQTALNEIQANITDSYPCEDCRENAIKNLKKFPLNVSDVKTKNEGRERLCNFHNVVRKNLKQEIVVDCKSF